MHLYVLSFQAPERYGVRTYEPCCRYCLDGEKKRGEEQVYLFPAAEENMCVQYGNLHERDPLMLQITCFVCCLITTYNIQFLITEPDQFDTVFF